MISSVFTVVLTAIILRYVLELEHEKCPCSLTWQHTFIKSFAPVVLVVALISLLVSPKTLMGAIRSNSALGALFVTYMTLAIIYGIVLVLYFLKLRYSQCKCSRDWKQYGLLYPLISLAVLLLLVIIFNAIVVFGLLPKMIQTLKGKGGKGKSNNEVLNKLSKSVKNSSKARK
jgi:hypothetical protein